MFPSRWHVSFMETLVFSGVLDQRDITGSTLTELYQQTSHIRIFALKFNAWYSLVAHVCCFIIRFLLDQSIQRVFCSHLSVMILILREADWSKTSTSQVMGNQAILFFLLCESLWHSIINANKGFPSVNAAYILMRFQLSWGQKLPFTSNPHLSFRCYYSVQLMISMKKNVILLLYK